MTALADFHPTVRAWFAATLGAPSAPQRDGWPAIASGEHTLIAAPTGSGKTLAAFLHALDRLLREGATLAPKTRVLYVSPLKALGNDVQKNLLGPLVALRELDPSLPEVRVLVRTGDTPQHERRQMLREPPHVLVTTPESLYVLLTSQGGLGLLADVDTVIVDEIHALCPDKRGSHLALSLERLADHAGGFQRIGLSATQKPLERVASFLVGEGRPCRIVDAGHLRELDVAIETPGAPLSTVCSEDHWSEIHDRIVAHVRAHRTTLVFTNTRKLAERLARRLADTLGSDKVTSHHGSLSRERRLDAERRLKAGELSALVATASLELGIDIGDVDLVVQVGVTSSIAQFLQRVGRAGHRASAIPKGRLFPLTRDELVAATALLDAVRRRELDAVTIPTAPLDILAQQIVAACVQRTWTADELFATVRRAWPYRELTRADFDAVVALHSGGRLALVHADGVGGRLLQTKRSRLPAVTSGGAIPDTAEYQVILDPDGIRVGSVDEDFAIESTIGDVFQLGATSWRITKIQSGQLRVADAQGAPPSMPFWFGEGPARTRELAAAVEQVRLHADDPAWSTAHAGLDAADASHLAEYLRQGSRELGAVPTRSLVIAERFLDESGGAQLVIHAPFGRRVNRAYGLALRKRFCRGFGFELQAAANEEAVLLSLGPMHSFATEEVFDYLHPATARDVLIQAILATPLFQTRWRWNVSRALVVPRWSGGTKVPAQLLRMRADDALAAAFPEVLACGENLPAGDLPVPLDHPLVRQTIHDCLHDAMDVDGFLALLQGLRDGSIQTRAVDRPTPSVLAAGILNAKPYEFLDDAPLEERRTQAVVNRRTRDASLTDDLSALDPAAVQRVREQAWPAPENAEDLHEALCWMGFVTDAEADRSGWRPFLDELAAAGRAAPDARGRWFAPEAPRDERAVWRGRLEALGPTVVDAIDTPTLLALEAEGIAMRVILDGRDAWCHRRLLARIHRETVDRLRAAIEPVSMATFLRAAAIRQHADPGHRVEGPAGVAEVVALLSGLEMPAAAWEQALRSRLAKYRAHWLDQLTVSGELVWLRLWSSGKAALKTTAIALMPRDHLDRWLAWRETPAADDLGSSAAEILAALDSRGASFPSDLERHTRLLLNQLEDGLAELVARGLATVDSFGALRTLTTAPSKRRRDALGFGVGRVSRVPVASTSPDPDFVLDRLLDRWGVVFHRLLRREPCRVPWRDLLRAARARELGGELRGGYFVAGVSGEQFARPDAIERLRAARSLADTEVELGDADPLRRFIGELVG